MLHSASENKPCWAESHWLQKASWQNPSYVIVVILQLKRCEVELCLQPILTAGSSHVLPMGAGREKEGAGINHTCAELIFYRDSTRQSPSLHKLPQSLAATPLRKQVWDWSITVLIEQWLSYFLAEDQCIHTTVPQLSQTRRAVWSRNTLGAFIQ